MNLGAEIAAALPELRQQAESMMVDSCTIATATPGAWDEATGTYAQSSVTLYAGPCRVQRSRGSDRSAMPGEAGYVLGDVTVSVPMCAPIVPVGAVVTVTSACADPHLADAQFTILGPHRKSLSTARRYECVEVTRP